MDLRGIQWEGGEWINLPHNMNKLWALWTQLWNFGSHKMQLTSWLVLELSWQGLCYFKFVSLWTLSKTKAGNKISKHFH
jgi:hypothetical protein